MARITYPEVYHHLALHAANGRIKVREALDDLRADGRQFDLPKVQRLLPSYLDEHLATFRARSLTSYYVRDRRDGKFVMPVPRCGAFRWTAHVQAAIMDMDPRKFEVLVSNVLASRECTKIAITPQSRDGGFDFVGEGPIKGSSPPPLVMTPSITDGLNYYVYGQAKRYSLRHPIERREYSALKGDLDTLQRGTRDPVFSALRDELLDWGWDRESWSLPMVGTSGRFRSPLRGVAHQEKAALLDGEQIAQRVLSGAPRLRDADEATEFVNEYAAEPLENVHLLHYRHSARR